MDDPQGRTPTGTWLLYAAVAAPLLPVFANSFRWIFTEVGRQPWIVFGLMTTASGVSPSVSMGEVITSMSVFTLLYGALAVVEIKLFLHYVRKGAEPSRSRRIPPTVTRMLPSSSPTERTTTMDLATFWFIVLGVLWTGYLVLEGFDFGVGMLLPVLGGKRYAADAEDAERRRLLINTIGPVWDGNEVWVLTAGGATFAAFHTGTQRCSAVSTCRSCSSWSRSSCATSASSTATSGPVPSGRRAGTRRSSGARSCPPCSGASR